VTISRSGSTSSSRANLPVEPLRYA
jgi:hypothetical protein